LALVSEILTILIVDVKLDILGGCDLHIVSILILTRQVSSVGIIRRMLTKRLRGLSFSESSSDSPVHVLTVLG
jgi:hypothetical protein